jgi:PPOX class probable F420-dependent enzyme
VGDLARLGNAKTAILETRKRDGTWVSSPVSLAWEGTHAYFHTYDASGKFKRLRNFPEVRLTRASYWGRAAGGPAVPAVARRLAGDEAAHAQDLIAARFPVLHGQLVARIHRRWGWATIHYELTAADGDPG